MVRRQFIKAVMVISFPLFVTACRMAVNDGLEVSPATQEVENTSPVEAAIIANEHPRIIASFGGIYENHAVEKTLASMIGQLVAKSSEPGRSYHVTILNSPAINAFALPGGYLYVTRGLLALASDSAEVAAVLAHEMAHVTANHAIKRENHLKASRVVSQVVADVLKDQTAAQSTLASSKVSLASFSRAQETEADKIGIRTIAQAGYDPYGAARFLKTMGRYAQLQSAATDNMQAFLASHPSTPARVQDAVKAARQFGGPGIGRVGRQSYLRGINGMLFGDDPHQGFVRDRSFIHPALRFQFTAPKGFSLENTPQAVLGTAKDGSAMRFDGVDAPVNKSLDNYLTSGWVDGLLPKSVRSQDINGLQTATAIAKVDGWTFRIALIRVGKASYRIIFASKNDTPAFQKYIPQTLAKFRKLSVREANGIKPLRVNVITARKGDTVETFSKRMKTGSNDRGLFMILNGLTMGDKIKKGELYKIIVQS